MTQPSSAPRLHVVGDDPASTVNSAAPEALFISALLASGQYSPSTYGIHDHQIAAHTQVHEACKRYQAKAGQAPPIHYIRDKYPSFIYTPDIHPAYAAHILHEAWRTRMAHVALAKASYELADSRVDDALAILKAGTASLYPLGGRGVDLTDFTWMDDQVGIEKCPVSAPGMGMSGGMSMLHTVTGGIAPGDLWYVGARLGAGKTWKLVEFAVAAAMANWNVLFLSLEMTVAAVMDRITSYALREVFPGHWDDIVDDEAKKAALLEWTEGKGKITVFGSSHTRNDASVAAIAAEMNAILIVDYVAKLTTHSGKTSKEDWQTAGTISNELKAAALEHSVPIIAAAQLNREASRVKHPDAAHLAESDEFGRDADLVLTLSAESRRVRSNFIAKYRHGETGDAWYSRFEPGIRRFEDITPDIARDLIDADEERRDNHT